jgi:N-acetylglucosaminyldiphosphoundecaprenol N-acetyl-beta-D-mannosaminyltransferase
MNSNDTLDRLVARTGSVARTENGDRESGDRDADVYRTPATIDAAISIFGLSLAATPSLHHAESVVQPHVKRRPRTPFLVTFANPLAVKLVGSDWGYRANMERMSLVFCDGISLTWAARWLGRFPMERISFDTTSIAPSVFRIAEEHERTIALVGGRPGVAEAAAERIRQRFPRLRIVAAIDGFRPASQIISAVIAIDPDIVVCGMGAPRQEALLTALADAGWCGTGFTCGGYLDQLVERFDFYPAVINRLNLRWLYRIAREPRRLGYRYVVNYAPFLRAIAQKLVRDLVRGSGNSRWRSRRS